MIRRHRAVWDRPQERMPAGAPALAVALLAALAAIHAATCPARAEDDLGAWEEKTHTDPMSDEIVRWYSSGFSRPFKKPQGLSWGGSDILLGGLSYDCDSGYSVVLPDFLPRRTDQVRVRVGDRTKVADTRVIKGGDGGDHLFFIDTGLLAELLGDAGTLRVEVPTYEGLVYYDFPVRGHRAMRAVADRYCARDPMAAEGSGSDTDIAALVAQAEKTCDSVRDMVAHATQFHPDEDTDLKADVAEFAGTMDAALIKFGNMLGPEGEHLGFGKDDRKRLESVQECLETSRDLLRDWLDSL